MYQAREVLHFHPSNPELNKRRCVCTDRKNKKKSPPFNYLTLNKMGTSDLSAIEEEEEEKGDLKPKVR